MSESTLRTRRPGLWFVLVTAVAVLFGSAPTGLVSSPAPAHAAALKVEKTKQYKACAKKASKSRSATKRRAARKSCVRAEATRTRIAKAKRKAGSSAYRRCLVAAAKKQSATRRKPAYRACASAEVTRKRVAAERKRIETARVRADADTPPIARARPSAGTAGAGAVGTTRHTVPAGAVYVSADGNDGHTGTKAKPLATVTEAIRKTTTGGTIVLRGGTYRQTFILQPGKQRTVQAYPGEAVWFDGSEHVTGWTADGGDYVRSGWTTEFDASPTYTRGASDNTQAGWGFVNPAFPMAAHPDQVWVDGVAQKQVKTRTAVVPGTFYVDYAADRLYLGTNPSGNEVLASTLTRAFRIRAAGTVIRGIGVRRYAPSVPHMGAVTVEEDGDNVTLEDVAITDSSTTGLHVAGTGAKLQNVTVARNGMLGASATYADGLKVSGMLARSNNTERFNTSPVAGGIKVGRTRGVEITGSVFADNIGTGVWFDESVRDGQLLSNDLTGNTKHGTSLEISATFVVADNIIANNGAHGIKVNNTSNVSIWNNTFAGNGRPVNIVQDARRPATAPGRDPRYPSDPAMTWVNGPVTVRNNILARTDVSLQGANCLLCVEDYTSKFSAEQMKVSANGNVYQYDAGKKPRWLVVWSRGSGNPRVFTDIKSFAAETGQDRQHLLLAGTAAVGSGWKATSAVTGRASTVAVPLPASVAVKIGRPTGVRQLGASVG